MTDDTPRICDYEGSTYRTDFWEGKGRTYEDTVERAVLRQLLPSTGRRLLELGAGFGRLSEEYRGYEQVVLLDYSFSQLQYARQQLGDEGYSYVAADAYQLPFRQGAFDAATMIRVVHHFEDVPRVLEQIRRVLANDATFILEFANKRNLKAMLRYAVGQQAWNPFTLPPVEFVELNYDFHPAYMTQALNAAGFQTRTRIPVSWLRLGVLKENLSAEMLASADAVLQKSGLLVAPSVFTQNVTQSGASAADNLSRADDDIFACPLTGGELTREGDTLVNADGTRWAIRDGIYDFKAPIEA